MSVKNIDSKTLNQWLKNNEAILIDVREPAEHAAEKISEANLLPLSSVNKNSLPKSDNKKIVLHCRSGGRSLNAYKKLIQEDPQLEIYNLEGGISAWSNEGFQVESSDKFFLPLDRQVQLIIGLGVLLGSILGFFVNKNFFLLSGFFGLGLSFAGLSGYCGLAIFMAKMPWNKASKNATSCSIK